MRLELTEGATDRLMEALRRNDLDLIFGRVLDRASVSELRVVEVYTESFEVVSAASHPLARKARVSWEDLSQARWILPATGSPLRVWPNSCSPAAASCAPSSPVEYSSFHQMRYVIAGSELVGLLPTSVALQGEAQGDIARLSPRSGPVRPDQPDLAPGLRTAARRAAVRGHRPGAAKDLGQA